jgi:hypothetical protein
VRVTLFSTDADGWGHGPVLPHLEAAGGSRRVRKTRNPKSERSDQAQYDAPPIGCSPSHMREPVPPHRAVSHAMPAMNTRFGRGVH